MGESVWPILVTAAFSNDETGASKRKRFLDDIAYRIDKCSGIGGGTVIDGVEYEDSPFYGVVQFHPYQSDVLVPPSEIYDVLVRNLDFLPKYIDGQRNLNGFLELSEDPKKERLFSDAPPPYPEKWKEEYPDLQWQNDRLAFIADDTTMYKEADEFEDMNVRKMSIVAIYVDTYALTQEELHEDFKVVNLANILAASLLGRDPEWCKERAIEAFRTSAGEVSNVVANLESGNLFFREMADYADCYNPRNDD